MITALGMVRNLRIVVMFFICDARACGMLRPDTIGHQSIQTRRTSLRWHAKCGLEDAKIQSSIKFAERKLIANNGQK